MAVFCVVTAVSYAAGFRGHGGAPVISSLTYGQFFRYNINYSAKWINGDTFVSAWADNDTIYIASNDTPSGFQGCCASGNAQFNSLDGYTTSLTGTTVNDMHEWGGFNGVSVIDNSTWKTSGMLSIGGTLLQVIYRQSQTAGYSLSAQIIKSTDHGANWNPKPPATGAPYNGSIANTPMFPQSFGAPIFIQYGKDYPGISGNIDRSAEFVYAVSGKYPIETIVGGITGRVPVGVITNLDPGDWTYYQGDLHGGNGANDANWGPLSSAAIIPFESFQSGTMRYLPYYKKYIMMYHCCDLPGATNKSTWHTYVCDHPWGPCNLLQIDTWNPPGTSQTLGKTGFYYPDIIQKSVVPDGGRHFTLTTTGDYNDTNNSTGSYTLWLVPVTVNP